ncbi:hypothetical protein BS47DRAFT_565401 [Hydnum rufescens UP504]|uniref:Uncharacterized protein n=1 Tax=Hydnum rufescens UP504 TaxID=1448309 RepID=A0A9P6AGJ7_9AGAM|nr:hypothetical protein BS47DRAFT_565401 [Hydnum rufescens UP504]
MAAGDDFTRPMDAFIQHLSKDEYSDYTAQGFEDLRVKTARIKAATRENEATKLEAEQADARFRKRISRLKQARLQIQLGLRDKHGNLRKQVTYFMYCCIGGIVFCILLSHVTVCSELLNFTANPKPKD